MATRNSTSSIGEYLLQRLHEAGAHHIFGVPGDYILKFYEQISQGPVRHIGTTREDTAAFAADGYARCRGIGAMAITYGVGALNVVNAVAGAYAESSPVVVISGAPGVWEQREDPLLHHRFGPYTFQREIFDRITCATTVLDDPITAFRQIDRTIAAAQREHKPVYIELPRDRVTVAGVPLPAVAEAAPQETSDAATLDEAVAETLALLAQAESPVLIAGVEVHRCGLQDALVDLVVRAGLPVAATLTGKSVVGERHPAYIGVYEGAASSEHTRQMVERADVLIMLGVTLNDVDTGVYTANLDPHRLVRASQGEVNIRYHRYPRVQLQDFIGALARQVSPRREALPSQPLVASDPAFPVPGQAMTTARLIARLNGALTPEMIVVSDVGDCLFAAIELRVCERSEFLASAYYTTMGFAVPAALGAQVARPDRRALILVGDGAFQMTGTELSTHARLYLAPIIIVFNNAGYSTERNILEGPFNDIAAWRFDRLGEVFGPLHGYDAKTEDAFETALARALAETGCPSLINVHLSPDDASPAMRRLTERLSHRVGNQ
ncbi:MAG: alpha-keto acid decarboxylase family protein [Methylothermaceae bacterium]|nr:alpha-keto acid decarboxylase family protein [Methylothermaceae bacterium]